MKDLGQTRLGEAGKHMGGASQAGTTREARAQAELRPTCAGALPEGERWEIETGD
jgi:hypothetical protein